MPKFEWHSSKAARNLHKHGISFEEVKRVFDDPLALDDIDDREDYGEERSNIMGMAGDRVPRHHLHAEGRQGPHRLGATSRAS
jgi:uncharacterized DUF497 family protein